MTHDRVFIAGKYVPVKRRTPQMILNALRRGDLKVYDQSTDRRIWRYEIVGEPGAERYGRRQYAGVISKPLGTDPYLTRMRGLMKEFYADRDAVQDEIVEGFVYVITNPAWPEWVKVGHSTDPEKRLTSYQTAGPHRDWSLEYYHHFGDRVRAEAHAHELLAQVATERQGEWFKASVTQAIFSVTEVA